MIHGWPGSIVELLETIGPLTDPAAPQPLHWPSSARPGTAT
jgi:hypothetical protein